MSLIADALKRAQEQRARSKDGKDDDDRARRMLTGSGPLKVETRDGVSVPKSVGIAGTVLAAALVTFGGVVWLAPRADDGGAVARSNVSNPPPPSNVAEPRPEATGSPAGRESGRAAGGVAGGAPEPSGVAAAETRDTESTENTEGTEAGATAEAGAAERPVGPVAEGGAETGETSSFTLRLQGQEAPSPVDASELFGRALGAQQRGELRTAVALYRRAIERNPSDAQLHNNLGTVYRRLSMPGEALAAFRTAVDVDRSYAPAWSNLGIMLDALGRDEEAIEAFREALRHDPSNNGARVNLANKYIGMGVIDEARSLLNEVLRDAPALPEAHYAMARAMETAGDTTEAIRHYRVFLDVAEGRFPALASRVEGHLEELEGGGG